VIERRSLTAIANSKRTLMLQKKWENFSEKFSPKSPNPLRRLLDGASSCLLDKEGARRA
jgi:hypothetical protein